MHNTLSLNASQVAWQEVKLSGTILFSFNFYLFIWIVKKKLNIIYLTFNLISASLRYYFGELDINGYLKDIQYILISKVLFCVFFYILVLVVHKAFSSVK